MTPTPSAGWDVVVLRVGGAGAGRDAYGATNVFLDRFPASCNGAGACLAQSSDVFRGTPAAPNMHSVRLWHSNVTFHGGVVSKVQTQPNRLLTVAYAPPSAAEKEKPSGEGGSALADVALVTT